MVFGREHAPQEGEVFHIIGGKDSIKRSKKTQAGKPGFLKDVKEQLGGKEKRSGNKRGPGGKGEGAGNRGVDT